MALETDEQAGLSTLVEFNEPEALLERIKRLADRRARELAHGLIGDELAAKRWRRLVDAINRVQDELDHGANQRDSVPVTPSEPA